MDVGTAKPDAATRARVPHHLLDLIDPTEAYSAARFRADAQAAIAAIRAHGRVPIVAGGTMLYVKALREGLSALPAADPAVRAELDARAADVGWPAMHAELARVAASGFAVPMSMPRYTCAESALTISPPNRRARASATADLPDAVGPTRMTVIDRA
jgi:tRNA A37 N6-isopentenylltransferase MiaA